MTPSERDPILYKLDAIIKTQAAHAESINDINVNIATVTAQNDTRIRMLEGQNGEQYRRILGLESSESCSVARNNEKAILKIVDKIETQDNKINGVLTKLATIGGGLTVVWLAIRMLT